MINQHRVLLITEEYPYGTGEEFISNEIPHLSERFNLSILPLHVKSLTTRRDLPDAVNLLAPVIAQSYSRIRRVLSGIYALPLCLPLLSWQDLEHILRNPRLIRQLLSYSLKLKHAISTLKPIVSQDKISMIYTYWFDVATSGALIVRNSKNSDSNVKPVVVTRAHRYDLYAEQYLNSWIPLRRHSLVAIDRVYAVSENGVEYLSTHYPESANKVALSYLGTPDYASILPVLSRPALDRTFRIVSLANLVPVKRIELLVRALSLLEDMLSCELEWLHIGDGPSASSVQNLAHDLLRRTQFRFAGHLDNLDAIETMNSFAPHFLVSTSESEGLPVSMMEAMNLGIPVIACAVGGVPEIVNVEVNGFLLPQQPTPIAIADTLRDAACLSENTWIKLSIAAKQTWAKSFSATTNYSRFVEDLSNLISFANSSDRHD